MTKMQEISTNVVKLDIETIYKNYLKPEFWKKEWVVFKTDFITLYARLCRIEVESNYIYLKIYCKEFSAYHKSIGHKIMINSDYAFKLIPINHPEYSQEKFNHDILCACLTAINYIEQQLIKLSSEYDQAVQTDRDYKNKLVEIAEEYLDSYGVSNDAIRTAYIDKYVNDNESYFANEHLDKAQYSFIPEQYLMCIGFFGDDKVYNDYVTNKIHEPDDFTKAYLEAGEKLNSDEFVKEMKDNLEAI